MTPALTARLAPTRRSRPARRGNYAMLLAVSLVVVLGFGAITIDVGYMLLSQQQAQGVADAASQAAMIMLRQTGDQNRATAAAQVVVDMNLIAGQPGVMTSIQYGTWDDSLATPVFRPTATHPNAAAVTVAREGQDSIGFMFGRIFGFEDFEVRRSAISASRSLQFAIVLDITGSWGERDFGNARRALLTAFDMIAQSSSDADEVGLTIFTNRYAWLYTDWTDIADPANAIAVRANWSELNNASKAGLDSNHSDGVDCRLNAAPNHNNFNSPAGGCYPAMPREYTDESGTDHSTGIRQAQELFASASAGANYRAMIILTDGRPNTLGPTSGAIRASQGYVETRWPQYTGPVPREIPDIRTASVAATQELWDDYRVNTWVVSLIQDDPMMPAMAQGDGYYALTQDSSQLAHIFAQIVSEIPLAIVQ